MIKLEAVNFGDEREPIFLDNHHLSIMNKKQYTIDTVINASLDLTAAIENLAELDNGGENVDWERIENHIANIRFGVEDILN